MDLGWDPARSEANRRERGFGFGFAERIFEGETVEAITSRPHDAERRILALGAIEGRVFAVVYTLRGTTPRIISARVARRERRTWEGRG